MRVGLHLGMLAFVLLLIAEPAVAQRKLYNQDELAELLYSRRDSLDNLPDVTYRYHVLDHPSGNSIWARHELYKLAGEGDAAAGKERLGMVEFFNRVEVGHLGLGDTLIVPSHYGLDVRAYAPFPRRYPGATVLDKLFIIDKGVQVWAAYEHGALVRWGLVNTGKDSTPTPAGRFNFNWQELERISSESPPDEEWLMRYVFNFHNERGIHIHQYQMPTGEPASHGCVRLIMADAKWIYGWADPWVTTNGRGAKGGRVKEQGTTVLVLGDGEEPRDGPPQRFVDKSGAPVLRMVELPDDPFSVPPGSPQQHRFDRQRG